ncbi:glycosyltransferase [Priestia flexa]|uniref:CgeB family protein n=1 Tax=Priestia flexa TaxID=86664 RepID=UPI00288C747A|nr:glycosyltransferase [Priestia flexa]MDT2047761.1 glycosyltransferase [Priestia flexa]
MIIDIQDRMKLITQKRKWAMSQRITNFEFVELEMTNGWFKKHNIDVSFSPEQKTFTTNLSSNEFTYLTYREQNLDFQLPPKEELITVSQEETVSFKGTKDKGMEVDLFIIEYSNELKLTTHRVEMNSEKLIHFAENTDKVRLAIRIKGNGNFKLEKILIGSQSFWSQGELVAEGKYIVLDQNNWYIPKSTKLYYNLFEQTFHASFDQKQFAYISHQEGNAAFSQAPKQSISVTANNIAAEFTGDKDADVDVRLALVFYKNDEKVFSDELKLNTKRLIKPEIEFDAMRLAIRVSGKGQFSVESISINNVAYWWKEDFSIDRRPSYINASTKVPLNATSLEGWGKSKGKVVYHPWNQFFQSKLTGQEFLHLHCINEMNEENRELSIQPNYNYTITPTSQMFGDIDLTLYVMGYNQGKQTELHQVSVNRSTELRFKKETDSVQFLVRVSGQGYFKGLQLNIDEQEIEITNSLALDLKHSSWFIASKKLAQLSTSENSLHGEAKLEPGKNVYMSYKEKNNHFASLPTYPLMTMQQGFEYDFSVRGKVEEGVSVIPMFIGYSDNEKVQVLQLKFNGTTKIQAHPDVNQFRLALRVSGKGGFEVEQFTVKEMKSLESEEPINYVDKTEIDAFEVLPPKPLKQMKMAVIFDEFTTASYEHECQLIKMTPDNWREVMTKEQPDLLMVESAWRGNGGVWDKRVGYYGEENMKPLFALLQWCKENNVPTVFWNKEDPVHFNRFIETARRFDYIFTTDENMVPFYQEQAGHENAFALPFAAQPAIHNPIKIVENRESKACFAGSYYRHHEERCIDMDRLLDAAAKVGLDIYDRNYIQNLKGLMPNHQFPDRFQPFVKGNLKYYEIDKAYKGYKVMINVNTVKESPTMFSRRVYEGLACGTPVISTYAQGINHIFGDLVYMSENPEELYEEFKQLLENNEYYEEKALIGIRDVLTKHTYTHRLSYVIEKIGLNFVAQSPTVTVVAMANSKEEFEDIVNQFNRQSYENKKLYVLIDTFDGYLDVYNKYNTSSIHTFVASYMHNYLNIRDWINTPYVTYFSQDSYYGENYLLDLMLSTTFTDSDFIGKRTYYTLNKNKLQEKNSGQEYEFVTSLTPERTIAKTNVYSNHSLEEVLEMFKNKQDLSPYARFGKQFFSSDKFNYVHVGQKEAKQLDSILKKVEL